jgi:hypothetical protein
MQRSPPTLLLGFYVGALIDKESRKIEMTLS